MEKQLYLRAFEYSDLSFLNKLRNDDRNYQMTTSNKYYISSEHDRKWIEDKIFNNYNQLYLIICKVDTKEPIGYICATNIDYINRKAEYGGIVISLEHNNCGFGLEAGVLFLNHIFEELGMNMLYAFVKEDNEVSINLLEKCGCVIEGVIRDYVYKQGRFYNAYIFTMLRSEYKNLKKKMSSIPETVFD